DTRLRVTDLDDLAEATLSLGELSCLLASPSSPGVARLIADVASARAFGDVYACTLVLNGQADLWIEAGVKIWDIAPLKILVEEAGGRFTDFRGAPTVASGEAIASNGRLHDVVLARLGATDNDGR